MISNSDPRGLSPLAFDVRRYDKERFVTALFCPPDKRNDVMALLAFNVELARVRQSIREPLAGMIRLQWWRDVVESTRPEGEIVHHPIAGPLTALLESGRIARDEAAAMVDARERDVAAEPFAAMADLMAYAWATSGGVGAGIARICGADDDLSLKTAREAASAYALIGLLRSLRFHLKDGWVTLPADVLDRYGLAPEAVKEGARGLTSAVAEIGAQAARLLDGARGRAWHSDALPACLVGTLATGHLRGLRRSGWNPFDPSLAKPQTMPVRLVWNAWRKRF